MGIHQPGLSFDEFLRRRGADRRLARLTHDVVLPVARGLEFGAGTSPIPLPDTIMVEYVDHEDGAGDGASDGVKVNHVWAGSGSLATICGHQAYDFAVASQVAQYVPNLLGWFAGIFEVLRPGGVLNLALPDRRFMFDLNRHASTLGELLEAYYLGYERPSIRQAVDHTFGAMGLEPSDVWSPSFQKAALRPFAGEHALELAFAQAQAAIEGSYVSSHCWVFTPISFLNLLEAVSRLGLFSFVISQFASTEPGGFEFFVCLRRDGEEDPAALKEKQLSAIAYVRDIAQRQSLFAERLAGP